MATVIWSPDKGWHDDGANVTFISTSHGPQRIVTVVTDLRDGCGAIRRDVSSDRLYACIRLADHRHGAWNTEHYGRDEFGFAVELVD